MDFKVVAIKPLRGCNRDYLKILKSGTIYYFLNDYEITNTSIRHNPSLPENFFSKGEPNINVSAIVGKNGSGKSSLIELLMRAINNLAISMQLGGDVEWIKGVKLELYIQTDSFYKIVFGRTILIFQQGFRGHKFRSISKRKFKTLNFFYSIVVNYSHYGLNTREMGGWLEKLFHKNDGYQTPIVINPMRNDGVIDINIENSLVKSRLISNILRPIPKEKIKDREVIQLTDNLIVTDLSLKLKEFEDSVLYNLPENIKGKSKRTPRPRPVRFSSLKINHNELLKLINTKYNFKYKGDWGKSNYVNNLAYKYIIKKLVKIAITYPLYSPYFDKERLTFRTGEISKFLELLFSKNENHISFKLKQTLNFLRYRQIRPIGRRAFKLNVISYSDFIARTLQKDDLTYEYVIELIPPPIFDIDILMSTKFYSKDIIKFSSLSSGEKQLIYSINSIIYHLVNLDSIKHNRFQRGYRFVNIVLEEIELYFHPNWQKNFINTLLRRLQDVAYKRVLGINVILTTHSPFILSDIPNTNILFLADGRPKTGALDVKTFGANIHDLLKFSFFSRRWIVRGICKR